MVSKLLTNKSEREVIGQIVGLHTIHLIENEKLKLMTTKINSEELLPKFHNNFLYLPFYISLKKSK